MAVASLPRWFAGASFLCLRVGLRVSLSLARSPPPLRGGGVISLLSPRKGQDSSGRGASLKGQEPWLGLSPVS